MMYSTSNKHQYHNNELNEKLTARVEESNIKEFDIEKRK